MKDLKSTGYLQKSLWSKDIFFLDFNTHPFFQRPIPFCKRIKLNTKRNKIKILEWRKMIFPINLWKFSAKKKSNPSSQLLLIFLFLSQISLLGFFCFHFISKYKIISLKSFSVSVSWNNFYNPNGFSITFYKNQLVGVCVWRTWRRLLIVVWDSTSFRLFLHHKPLVLFYYIFINFQLGFSIFTHKSDQFHSITGKSVTHNLGVVLFILFFYFTFNFSVEWLIWCGEVGMMTRAVLMVALEEVWHQNNYYLILYHIALKFMLKIPWWQLLNFLLFSSSQAISNQPTISQFIHIFYNFNLNSIVSRERESVGEGREGRVRKTMA